ncbi:LytR/AlgR family response regulator transcription factor [Paraflavitalea pollutisoli]|uniref:LytR/AlgR family response regulator transcription factor n=1 Tax=Paraflavitalea pollutisoli TaxID=3034143 RepID=UPI0023EBB0FF|nr:LytTR family DNA-binding domain-containing protein [Paraflavitalea sp. H1-2-19X]
MTNPLRCIIVDDDEIDRLTTVALVKQYPVIQVTGVYDHPGKAMQAMVQDPPDIAFLDVDMPGMSGLELRRQLSGIPACVFITSYPEYAVESFELAAIDFIVKPLRADRFAMTMERLQQYMTLRQKAQLLDHTLGGDTIFIKEGTAQVKLSLHEIIYLEALKDYTRIVTSNNKHCVLTSLGNLLQEPGFQNFLRVHKSFAVQKQWVERIGSQDILVKGTSLPVGRAYKENLAQLK